MAVDLLTRLVEEGLSLPIHLARKKVPAIDLATGELEVPEEPNAFKMERFLFDVLPHARRVSVMKTRREEEFAPVKTLVGPDSVESCRKALMRRM